VERAKKKHGLRRAVSKNERKTEKLKDELTQKPKKLECGTGRGEGRGENGKEFFVK